LAGGALLRGGGGHPLPQLHERTDQAGGAEHGLPEHGGGRAGHPELGGLPFVRQRGEPAVTATAIGLLITAINPSTSASTDLVGSLILLPVMVDTEKPGDSAEKYR